MSMLDLNNLQENFSDAATVLEADLLEIRSHLKTNPGNNENKREWAIICSALQLSVLSLRKAKERIDVIMDPQQ